MPASALVPCHHCKCYFRGERGLKVHRMSQTVCHEAHLQIQKYVKTNPPKNKKRQTHNTPFVKNAVQHDNHTNQHDAASDKRQKSEVKTNTPMSDDDGSFLSFEFADSDDNQGYSTDSDPDTNVISKNTPSDYQQHPQLLSSQIFGSNNGRQMSLPVNISEPDATVDMEIGTTEGGEDNPFLTRTPDESLLDMCNDLTDNHKNGKDTIGLETLSLQEKLQVDLLRTLMRLKAPIKTFKEVLDWAKRANDAGFHFSAEHPSRERLLSNLKERHQMHTLKPKQKLLKLPHSQKTVNMVYFDAKSVFASLLTCPILNRDENFLFHGNSPFAPPPDVISHIGDINTSRGYLDSYHRLVKNPAEDILLPCILAMDKTHCDTFGRLQMEPITISYGLMKHSTRSSPMAMRILGYINHSPNIEETHVEEDINGIPTPSVSVGAAATMPHMEIPKHSSAHAAQNANDYHAQLQFILKESGFLSLQDCGFKWILHYRGEDHKVTFRLYIPFIIGDTEGHDLLCGHYKCRTGSVAQLCRACECPTNLSGWSKANFPFRRQSHIKQLVRNRRMTELQELSQHFLSNGCDNLRFANPQRGIFGAVPGEILHVILLGWFKYTIEAFLAQAGSNTQAIKLYDDLFKRVGIKLSRQSDRDLPRTVFRKGLSSGGHIMAEEVPGCLLVMLFTMHTQEYLDIFSDKKKYRRELGLGNKAHITDWITLLCSLLQWLAWLKQETISKRMIRKSMKATRWLIRLFKFVSPRTKGMCNNTIKIHLVLHMAEDMLNHGVPQNFNSAFMESAHIPLAKDTSRNTQKRSTSFTYQAAHRYVENLTILRSYSTLAAVASSTNNEAGDDDHNNIANNIVPVHIDHQNDNEKSGGRKFTIVHCNNTNVNNRTTNCYWTFPRKGDANITVPLRNDVKDFLITHCLPVVPSGRLLCFTEYVNPHTNTTYRAHPNYMGGAWYDCALIRWYQYPNPLPARICTFLDISSMLPGTSIDIPEAGQYGIGPGLYAVVESFNKILDNNNPENHAEYSNTLIGRYERDEVEDGTGKPILYLAEVGSLIDSIVGMPNRYNPQGNHDGNNINPQQAKLPYLFLLHRRKAWPKCWESVIRTTAATRRSNIIFRGRR